MSILKCNWSQKVPGLHIKRNGISWAKKNLEKKYLMTLKWGMLVGKLGS